MLDRLQARFVCMLRRLRQGQHSMEEMSGAGAEVCQPGV